MRADHYQKFVTVKQRLLDAEAAHPKSPELKALHEAMGEALDDFGHLFTDEQFQPLSGGTEK